MTVDEIVPVSERTNEKKKLDKCPDFSQEPKIRFVLVITGKLGSLEDSYKSVGWLWKPNLVDIIKKKKEKRDRPMVAMMKKWWDLECDGPEHPIKE